MHLGEAGRFRLFVFLVQVPVASEAEISTYPCRLRLGTRREPNELRACGPTRKRGTADPTVW